MGYLHLTGFSLLLKLLRCEERFCRKEINLVRLLSNNIIFVVITLVIILGYRVR